MLKIKKYNSFNAFTCFFFNVSSRADGKSFMRASFSYSILLSTYNLHEHFFKLSIIAFIVTTLF